jgi:hypothetical protein
VKRLISSLLLLLLSVAACSGSGPQTKKFNVSGSYSGTLEVTGEHPWTNGTWVLKDAKGNTIASGTCEKSGTGVGTYATTSSNPDYPSPGSGQASTNDGGATYSYAGQSGGPQGTLTAQ